MKTLPSESVNLVLTDPPYGIKFAKWDTWKTAEDYIAFMLVVFKECERVLTNNGSLYWFHNDLPLIARLMEAIRTETNFNFNSFITCDKGEWRALSWKNPQESSNLRSWFNTCEYCLYYNKRSGVQTEWDRTGLEKVKLDVNNFTTLRKYAYDMLLWIGGGSGLAQREYSKKWEADKPSISSIARNGKQTVMKKIGGVGDHFTRYGSTQWDLCTEETYNKLIETFNLREWDGFREYEDLRREYEDLRFTHTVDKNHNNIMKFKRDKGKNWHPCQKPINLLSRLICCSSKKNDTILDPFMGSGSTGVACVKNNRNFIGCEIDKKYFDIAKERIEEEKNQLRLF